MDRCPCLTAKVTVSGDVRASVSCSDQPGASVSMGTVVFRDGTNDYERLVHKPSINSVELVGDKTLEELGDSPLSNIAIQSIFDRVFG